MIESEVPEGVRKLVISLLRMGPRKVERKIDFVAVEEPIHILLNGEHYATILCTSTNKEALVMGNLVSEGIVYSPKEIKEIEIGKMGE